MKVNKNFTLDSEIVEKTKEIQNASNLVNELLTQYFGKHNDIKREKLETNLLIKEQESKRINKEIDLITKQLIELEEIDDTPFNEEEIGFLKDSVNAFINKNDKAQQMRFNAFKRDYRLNYRFEDFKTKVEEIIEEDRKRKEERFIQVNKNRKEIGEEPLKSINEFKIN